MALFVRRTPSAPVVVAPGPEWPVYELLRTPGGRDLLPADVADRLLDPEDSLGIEPKPGQTATGPGQGEDGSGAGASDETKTSTSPQFRYTAVALGLFVLGVVLAVNAFATPDDGPTYKAAAGIGAFALFYIAAQAAERLAELVLPYFEWVPGFGKAEKEAKRDKKVAAAYAQRSKAAEEAAAEAQAAIDQARANRTAVVFGFTAAAGMWLCGYLEADFLTAVGVTMRVAEGAAAPTTFQQIIAMVVTGLIVGGGSKGLHDLISNISKSNSSKETPSELGGAK